MVLSDYSGGRNNNFNLIRFVAAMAVLVSHGFALTTGDESIEPFRKHLNMTVGGMAVDVFFLTSGFLVTASLLTRKNAFEFVCARALRIYPALWTMLILTVLLLGSSVTTLALPSYLVSPQVWSYLGHGATLLAGVKSELPGVFDANPIASGINGSLWTLPYEIGMYGILLAGWLIAGIFGRRRAGLLEAAILATAALAGLYVLIGYFRHGPPEDFELHRTYRLSSLLFMFFCGGSFYVLRDRIRMSSKLFGGLLAVLLASAVNKHSFHAAYILCIPYLLFYIAYVPAGLIRAFNKLGDYSYGIYIYAFPVHQAVVYLLPGSSILASTLACALITLLLSVASWHLIEESALDFKTQLSQRLRGILEVRVQQT